MPLSPVPDVGEVTRQSARDDEDRVDPDVVAVAGVARRQPFGRDRDPAQAVSVEAPRRRLVARPLLHLDEGQRSAAPCDQVDLAAGNACAAVEDAPPVESQPPRRERLRAPALSLGPLTGQSRPPSSSARA